MKLSMAIVGSNRVGEGLAEPLAATSPAGPDLLTKQIMSHEFL
jgi:hypothetical protein